MNVREEFICFLHYKWGLSGKNLPKLILEALDDLTLPIDNCRGQGYGGAGAGHINGLAGHILRLNPKALYTHCYSHRLNLSVCDTLSILKVKMLKDVGQAANFINISETRNMLFADHIEDSDLNTKKIKLVSLCKTRWVEWVESLDTFQDLFIPLIDTLHDIANNVSGETKPSLSADASSLLTLITKFDFIVALVITRHILDATLLVTQLLQGKSIDIMDGFHLIQMLKNNVTQMRTNTDFYHNTCYEEALKH